MSGRVRRDVERGMCTGITLVGVSLDGIAALGERQLRLGNDLVEGEGTTAKNFARIAMAREKLDYQALCWNAFW
jgi:hypothetical protein